MAYCPKCGVEVENNIRSCPLCDFPIPDIESTEGDKVEVNKYPEAINIYKKVSEELKHRLFYLILFISVCGLLILTGISIVFDVSSNLLSYIGFGFIAVIMYTFFILMFKYWMVNVIGSGITTGILLFNLAEIGGYTWFIPLGLPLVIWTFTIMFIGIFMYKRVPSSTLNYIPTYVLLTVGTLCLGLDMIISLYLESERIISWSIIVFISCIAFALIAGGIMHLIPVHVKERFDRRLHM